MSAADDPRTYGRARLGFADEADIDEFASVLGQFERGEIGPDAWRAFRLVRGTYGQRQAEDAQMLRVKMPQGLLDRAQLEALADVADRYSRGFGHITTRQNLQFHFMRLHDIEPAMRRLAEAGLTTREACGSSVRNITACPFAGVAADEVFDVTPYAEALTRHLLRHPLSSKLPRKFKIAFEGCPVDHIRTGVNDIGFRAAIGPDGLRGFRITVAGGTSIMPRSGALLHELYPAGAIFDVADAVIRVFAALGDYQHKQRNRLKFLIKSLGWDRWREEYDAALAAIRAEDRPAFPFDPEHPPVEEAPAWRAGPPPAAADLMARAAAAELRGPGIRPLTPAPGAGSFDDWMRTNVRPQKQTGYAIASATIPLGDITAAQLRILADLADAYSDGTLRVTTDQNAVFRWVPVARVNDFYRALRAAGFGLAGVGTIADVVSCPGAESCRLAVTQSRGLGRLLGDHLRARADVAEAAGAGDIKISGCPNGCGLHHVAAIGFQGSIRKVGARAVPQYFVMAGGGADADGAAFGRIVAKVPARRCPEAVERLVAVYQAERHLDEGLAAFMRRADLGRLKAALSDLEPITEDTADASDFIDLAEDKAFAPEVLDGECSA
jgi:sulfite reductase (NADPH) hemoprotein beta-component